MPIYEYRCTGCGRTVEVIQKLGDAPLRSCPDCSGSLEKLVSRTSFQLRGGGWFAHEYGSAKPSGQTDGKAPDSGSDASPPKEPEKKKPSGSGGSGSCGCAS